VNGRLGVGDMWLHKKGAGRKNKEKKNWEELKGEDWGGNW